MTILELIFWVLVAIIIYVFIGYPLLCLAVSKLSFKPVKKDENYLPTVTIVISAYNEEAVIEDKLRNTLELDYLSDRLEIIVASDGSTDKTNSIVKRFSDRVKLLEFSNNRGKTQVQNDAVEEASGEIIVFSDANAIYDRDAVKKLCRNFGDEEVGCVCGELKYMDEGSAAGEGEGFYWRYEKFLKRMESRIGNVLGANGSIYAVRRDLHVPLDRDMISDFIEPLKIVKKGFRAVYEPEAVSYEHSSENFETEFRRKVRIINRSYRGLLSVSNLLNPFKYKFLSISLISHKLLRWFAGVVLILVFVINIILAFTSKELYGLILAVQIAFYVLALVGIFTRSVKKPFLIPAYFCIMNISALLGLMRYYFGRADTSWQPVRK